MYYALRGLDAPPPAVPPRICHVYEQRLFPLYMIAALRRTFAGETPPSMASTKQTAAGTTGNDGSNPADNENFDWHDDPD